MGVSSISSHFVGMGGGLLMSVIAFSIVFLVIVGLMLVMMGIKVLTRAIEAATAAKAAPLASAPTPPASGGMVHSTPAPVLATEDSGELIAVITAAIAAICGAGARIVSFAPTPVLSHGTPWRMTGRLQNSEGFAD